MPNSWIEYIKSIAEKEKVSYPVALMKAKETYHLHKQETATATPTPPTTPKKGKKEPDTYGAPVRLRGALGDTTVSKKPMRSGRGGN